MQHWCSYKQWKHASGNTNTQYGLRSKTTCILI